MKMGHKIRPLQMKLIQHEQLSNLRIEAGNGEDQTAWRYPEKSEIDRPNTEQQIQTGQTYRTLKLKQNKGARIWNLSQQLVNSTPKSELYSI